ncbi:unnamed protein product (macronuclear) [Paramecium tetraurelia]|uniref:Uncharacterized protein n=1 Tax=Paramecium tetraurelia TaxID=5888 RepID=A0D4V5_PARTE|nr:uncharacterized protein GSPATT00013519001 [Paramecium tetraurelia]CAK78072.1 unnamed protein product [Paramecium tetraurelia]|eukprot:XP_001445469.1 hypothetical protein (macronuclear) [Paramecium tetraurelia strain d4-2]
MLTEVQGARPQSAKKRVKERSVLDALHRVREWRRIFEQGKSQQNTNQPRISLQEAANLVQIPKKTLEDYVQIFKKVNLICRIEDFGNKRMGFLRKLIQINQAYIKTVAHIRKQKKNQFNNAKKEDPYQSKIKIEFEHNADVQNIKEEQLETVTIQEVKQEVKQEEQQPKLIFN